MALDAYLWYGHGIQSSVTPENYFGGGHSLHGLEECIMGVSCRSGTGKPRSHKLLIPCEELDRFTKLATVKFSRDEGRLFAVFESETARLYIIHTAEYYTLHEPGPS